MSEPNPTSPPTPTGPRANLNGLASLSIDDEAAAPAPSYLSRPRLQQPTPATGPSSLAASRPADHQPPATPLAAAAAPAPYGYQPSPSATAAALTTGAPDDKSALLQVLGGIAEMQRELSRLHQRLDSLEDQRERIGRRSSFYGTTPPSPAMRPRMTGTVRFPSPDKPLAPHLLGSTIALPQPAPLLAQEPSLGLWCVVPAGGAGTRLWPLSRESYPKFLLDLTGSGRTLLQSTWDRLLPLAGARRLMIVTGAAHIDGVSAQLPELDYANLLAEPSPKESMAAIGLAAAVLQRRDPDAVLGSFAADHIISGRDAFESAVTEAVAVAKAGYLVTIGIAPSYPSTGFGYIKLGDKLDVDSAPNARRVTEFKEKPDARTASAYLSTGDYRWNGGMFVVQAKVLMQLLHSSMPALHDGLDTIAAAWDTPSRAQVLAEIWPTLDKIAIDHAVAEPAAKAGRVAVVPATFGWDDVGDFSSLADLIPAEKGEARVLGDPSLVVTEQQAGGLIVPAAGRTIACLGVDDVVVVDTPDALLITTRARSQDVKKIVARCKKSFPELC